jgi:hypothetical protein
LFFAKLPTGASTIPTSSELKGDFSDIPCPKSRAPRMPIREGTFYDQLATVADLNRAAQCVRTPFAGIRSRVYV